MPRVPVVLYQSRCRDVDRWVIISMMVMCNGIVIIEYDRRGPGLLSAPMTTIKQRNTDLNI